MNSNYILFFDTETTGLPIWSDPSEVEAQPHIVQLAALLVDAKTRKIEQSLNVIVRPDGWTIPDNTIEVHGITNEKAKLIGIPETHAVLLFLDIWRKHKRVAFNTTFDNRIIRIATKRYFNDSVSDSWSNGKQGQEWECMMLASQKIMGERPSLGDAYKHFTGKVLRGAHNAMNDTMACMEIYFAIQDLKEGEQEPLEMM